MTDRNEHLPEHFLVDGVAPSVIGGADGPDDLLDEGYDYEPPVHRDPPTTPIPAQSPPPRTPLAQGPPDQRKNWLGRMFGRES